MDLQQLSVVDHVAARDSGNDEPPGAAPGEYAALLRQVRDGLDAIAVTRSDLGEQARVVREHLAQLSALAGEAADAGLIAEAREVCAHRESAGRDLAEIVRRLEAVVEAEHRLRVAERRLLSQATVPPSPRANAPPESASGPARSVAEGGDAALAAPTRAALGVPGRPPQEAPERVAPARARRDITRRERPPAVGASAGGVAVRSRLSARRATALVLALLILGSAGAIISRSAPDRASSITPTAAASPAAIPGSGVEVSPTTPPLSAPIAAGTAIPIAPTAAVSTATSTVSPARPSALVGPATAALPASSPPAAAQRGALVFSPYQSDPPGAQIVAIEPDGTDRRILGALPGHPWGVRLSPDGAAVLFSSAAPASTGWPLDNNLNGSGCPDIWVAGVDGAGARRLTDAAAGYNGWSWSPDGRWIAFASNRSGNWEIYKMAATGGQLTRLTTTTAQDAWPAWTPDGASIIFASTRSDRPQLYRMDSDGTNLRRLLSTPTADIEPSIAPVGGKIAFAGLAPDGTGEIYVVDSPGASPRRVTAVGGLNSMPVWSPDGAQLAFVNRRRDGGGDLYVINADGSGLARLTAIEASQRPGWVVAAPGAR